MTDSEGVGRWEVPACDPDAEARLRAWFGLGVPCARTLVARGHTERDEVARFLSPSLARDWVDPSLMPGMAPCVDAVVRAVRDGRPIVVFGDFDVDGMTATSLLTLGLRELGASVRPFIPDRFSEGYGVSDAAIERAFEAGRPDLLITVDTGIAALAQVAALRSLGVDVVVTDHHEPGDDVPLGVPLIDPKLASGPGSHDLAGAGVALKLLQAVGSELGEPGLWLDYVDLAALGTVSDLMPLEGENRALVAAGVERMRTRCRPSIAALCAVAHRDPAELEASDLPFYVVPRLNAPGRMGQADLSLDLLLTCDGAQAQEIAERIEQVNTERRATETALAEEALAKAERTYRAGDRCVVVGGEGWHEGVKGVCAARLVGHFGVPVVLFSIEGELARGSGRSVGSVDLYHAVERAGEAVVQFGGHAAAVGVTVRTEDLGRFAADLEAVLEELPAEEFVARTAVDAELPIAELDLDGVAELDRLRPFGMANPQPTFVARGVRLLRRQAVGRDGTHLRCQVCDGYHRVDAIRFRDPNIDAALAWDGPVDVAYRPQIEQWQGRSRLKLMLEGVRYLVPESEDGPTVTLEGPGAEALERRRSLAALAPEALEAELVHSLIGDHELLDAQRRTLDALSQGRSTLCVMATGRGKSLIFQVHALECAIARGQASIIVYPLRALVSDQAHHMGDVFEGLGVGLQTLTGEASEAKRQAVYEGLAKGTVDVVLTTPEFLERHAAEFAACGRVGFLVVDEAHHAGASKGRNRHAYQSLPEVRRLLGEPVVLGVSATLPSEVAAEAMGLTGATELVVDDAVRDNLVLDDRRGDPGRADALAEWVATGEKCLVYVSSRTAAMALTRELRHRLPAMGERISYYHAGLRRDERLAVEEAFREGTVSCVVATSAFGEGVNLPDVRHVVLYHLPFDAIAFNQSSGRAGRDGERAWVHLLFDEGDARVNEGILRRSAPIRDELVELWRGLRGLVASQGSVLAGDAATIAGAVAGRLGIEPPPEASVASGLAIFEELGFLRRGLVAGEPAVAMAPTVTKTPLESSIIYREGLESQAAFAEFAHWVMESDPSELRDRIIRPIIPTDVAKGGHA